jgi:hypothetical protein
MNTLTDIRRAIKPLGFKVTTKTTSYGRHATYIHIESGEALTFNVFTPEKLAKWKPLLDWRAAHKTELQTVRVNEDCLGLV